MAWTRGLQLRGVDRFQHRLQRTADDVSKRAAKAGTNAGLQVLVKAIRLLIDSSSAPPQVKAAARKTIGKRLLKKEGRPGSGKAGFAVGKRSRRKKETAHERYMRGQGGVHETRGTGISAANIHWFVLGTDERFAGINRGEQGKFQRDKNRPGGAGLHATGRIEAWLGGLVQRALTDSESEILEAARAKCREILEKEAAK